MPEIALLTNPTSGKGRGARARAVALPRLRAAGFAVRDLQGADAAEAQALARQCVADGVESLVVCGGDGMVHLAVQALAGSRTRLGVIPAGTGNDVARFLDLPRKDPAGAADVVIAGRTRTIDLARSGAAYFVTVLAAGFDAIVNERANKMTWPRGQMRYNLATLAELRVFKPLSYTLELDGVTRQVEAMLVAVGNGPSFGGGLRITEGALLDDGLLDVVIIKTMSKPDLIRTYPKLFSGTHTTHPQYELHRVAKVTVAAPGIVSYADGERFGALPLTIECAPGALTVLRMTASTSVLSDFAAGYAFPLDDFQVRACTEIEAGRGVLVAAPTGSGKTIVGEFAVHLALATGRKCFYTTPIKALSNQKFNDLVARYGAERVGLLTGDNSVNGEAPVVVMTTEVLRNMLYAGSRTLLGLGFVVMDEVHYLADRMRGAVWEEVIIHLPESVSVVSLSATVSNAEEFGSWLETVRGATTTIVEERRPVPLFQHVMVGRRMLDLFASSDVDASAGFVREGAPVNDELIRIARDDWASSRLMRDRRSPRKGRPGSSKNPRAVGNGRRVWIPSRVDVIDRLDRDGLLPAIYFIFSRIGCDAAVAQCLDSRIRLTTPGERDTIRHYVEAACRHLPDEDREVLGYARFLDGLERGVAAHHAGLLPVFKECVEQLFVRGLCKVVFATETLALGINMPARTVVIEKLVKFNGETHADVTPGEFTQLTGRAGRRGLDVEGHAVVLWQPGMSPQDLAGLASTRTYPLRSSFRPSYNMAVNLVHQFGRERSRELLEMSFAQFQADQAVVGLARQLRKAEDALEGYAEAASCHLGDFMEYAAIRRRVSDTEKGAAKARRADRRDEVLTSLAALRPGDVIQVPAGKFAGYAVVIDPGTTGEEPRPYVVTAERQARRLAVVDFPTPVRSLARLRVPRSFNGRNPQARRDLAAALRSRTHDLAPPPPSSRAKQSGQPDETENGEVAGLRAALKAHPCHACPDREDHARWGERWFKLDRDAATLRRRIETRTNTVARTFDRVCDVLTSLGYLTDEGGESRVTEQGTHLMRIYSESDLVAAEALRLGQWDDLTAAELASVLSVLVFEARRADDIVPRMPAGRISAVVDSMWRLWRELAALERDHRLDFLREPDRGFAWAAHRWAEGDDLDDVLKGATLAAGDFVRWMKQLIDLAGQVADAAGDAPLRRTARESVHLLRRGVVAYSSLD